MRIQCIFSFLLPLVISVTGNKAMVGSTFHDNFFRFNSDLWEADDQYLLCVSTHCVYLNESNLHFQYVDNLFVHTYLQIQMKNDCQGHKCCVGEMCTAYTSGQITSRHSYGYGSFRFLAIVHGNVGNLKDAWACFGVETMYDDRIFVNEYGLDEMAPMRGISACIPSRDPWHIAIIWQDGDDLHTKWVELHFNAAKDFAIYRLDWFPDRIIWYAKGKWLATMYGKRKSTIPSEPLNIKISLFPHLPNDIESAIFSHHRVDDPMNTIRPDDNENFDVRIHLFRVSYIEWDKETKEWNEKTELLVLNQTPQFILRAIIFIAIGFTCTFLIFIFLWNSWKHRLLKEPIINGSYILLDVNGER